MPVAVVVAEKDAIARKAVSKIRLEISPLEIITDPRIAFVKGELIIPSKEFRLGNTETALAACDYVFEGRADINGQEHLYIETQGAYTLPTEGGGLKVYSSTQGPTVVQRAVARVTGLPMHLIEVDVTRLGGGFGGKEDQANAWAAICAVATQLTGRPVKYSLHRLEDMRMTGKRDPYSADYRIGLDKQFKIQAYEVTFYQNAGAAADLSPPVLERTLFHCTNSYSSRTLVANVDPWLEFTVVTPSGMSRTSSALPDRSTGSAAVSHAQSRWIGFTVSAHPNGTPYVILSLEHCHDVVKDSIRLASGRDCLVGYGRNIDLLLLAVRTSFEHGKELGRFRPVDMTVIANFIRFHTKTFRLLQEYRQHRVDVVHVSPDNVAWEKAMMAALIVWPHSPIIDP